MALRAGGIETTIEAGTYLLPADTFVAAMLKATLGERPIHFMPGSSIVSRLGLWGHTVRQGLTWKLAEPQHEAPGVVRLPEGPLSGVLGSAIDLPLTDTLLGEVYLRRGRLLDPAAPWVDAATASIPAQYVYAHYAAGQARGLIGGEAAAMRHFRQAEWWQGVIAN